MHIVTFIRSTIQGVLIIALVSSRMRYARHVLTCKPNTQPVQLGLEIVEHDRIGKTFEDKIQLPPWVDAAEH